MSDEDDETKSKEDNSNNEEKEPETPDLKTLRHLHTDLRHSHTETLKTLDGISKKSGRLLSFNGTVLAILAAAGTLVDSNLIEFISVFTFIGVTLVLDSIFIQLWLHKTETVTVGVGKKERKISVGESDDYPPLNESAYLLWVNRYYGSWIDDAVEKGKSRGKILYISEVCSVLGIATILFGTLIAIL